jgi:hypothetical protein
MNDDRVERLLRGYRLPEVSPDLDARVLRAGDALLSHDRTRATAEDLGRSLLHSLGFGYLVLLFDLVTTTDAEYRVEFV